MAELPASVERHFPEGVELDDPLGRALAIATLLEDGDRADLAWLGARVPRAELVAWFDRHAARRLSKRSRSFWAAVLDRDAAAAPPLAEALWPLA